MNSFDDIFEGHISQRGQTNQPFDKEAWAEKKQAERQSVYDLADTTAVEVSADGSKFQSYLDVQTRFSRYSATNVLLILAQKPEATQLKDFNGWKEAGASIKRQQKGISILEPGEEYERADGSIGTSYNVKRVFDISQTTARAKVQPAISVDDRLLLKALISRSPVPMQTVDDLPNHMGALYDHDQQVIFVRRGMDSADIFRSVSKELAHAEIAGMEKDYTREGAAFAAYSVDKLNRYDLIILDIMMPDVDGFSYCDKIRSLVDCPILFLTAKTMEHDITFGLGLGADDYLTKPFRIAELRARVNAHLRRERRERHTALTFDRIKIDLSEKELRVDNTPVALTKSEYLICEYLARNKGQVFSKEQIYEAVFSLEGDSDNSTISTHIKNIRSKLNKLDIQPIATVWGIGYKWE